MCAEKDTEEIRSEYADMSNIILCENHKRQKSKVFCAPIFDAEKAGPLDKFERNSWWETKLIYYVYWSPTA